MARIYAGLSGLVGAFALLAGLALDPGLATPQATSAISPLAPDDVSWLFPPPKGIADRARLIAITDLTVPNPADPTKPLPAWSDAAFNDFLSIADSTKAQVNGGPRIGLPPAARIKSNWFVAGVRIDAGAPSLDPSVMAVFGQRPQIRLILQPVVFDAAGKATVVDTAAHLIFDFTGPQPFTDFLTCPLHNNPDLAAFKGVVQDAAALRSDLAAGKFANTKVSTAGLPLGVHPGLANPATAPAVAAQMKSVLERHISPQRLGAMAVMGLPTGKSAPWIFLSMTRSLFGHYTAVRGPTLDGEQYAMMLTPIGQSPRVAPTPHTNNLAPATCRTNVFQWLDFLPVASRRGATTADILTPDPLNPGKVKSITDLIADPSRSHFFNTDCVSCHTETRRAMEELHVTQSAGLSPDVMPNSPYDVRNFGWAPPRGGTSQGTATRRTANETAAVVAWLNANMLKR